ncbi:MAG: isoprenylcysteine carboxylmethyltransferase family protein [Calditrichaeota bacterium]|nr:MAG: isoprenylcysteine carboxylmethyltransferase family protein [Calditrichota bacterium]
MKETINLQPLKKMIITRLFSAYFVMGLLFFLPAGTIRYWEAWSYMMVIAIPMSIFIVYMFRHNPRFLERRMRVKEKRSQQRLIQKIGVIPFLVTLLLPGFDRRFGWSEISFPATVAGLALVLLGYLLTLYVFRANAFASRVVDVEEEQKLVTTGPYSLVRHPMYFSIIIFYLFTPIALGSVWSLIPAFFIIPFLMFRIVDEEKELKDNLAGYHEYIQKVKYRLLPGIW